VFVVDRIKDMIISGAESVYSAEVENVLALHPAVTGCTFIRVLDYQWGERVHTLVVLVPEAGATFDKLQQLCRRPLAGYKVPRSVEFVSMLPTYSGGKVVKLALGAERQGR
jgi:acyl-CoA synthetase (AMP-forming)/AMP-acid ligase II